ncbi:MAG: XRE family transcriptional regulator [Bacteroidales bacterium]|nr:XRE family transcriptional regulator [Bacteroidales bacterium]
MQKKTQIHIGKIIHDELHKQGRSAVWLSQQMHCDRTKIHRIFNSSDLYSDIIFEISKILNHDFFVYYTNRLKEEE